MPVRPEYVHEYDQTHFRLEGTALHLVSLFLADKELKRAYRGHALPHLETFAEEEKESEIIRLTIEIATAFRLMFWNARRPPPSESVGRLCADSSSNTWQPLTMLEACHKVIHAEHVGFETRRFPGTECEFIKPKIHVAGTKGKKEWLAEIDVLPFANAALQPIDPPF
jgi:hypothetical protein